MYKQGLEMYQSREKLRQELEAARRVEEVQGCTFHPQINHFAARRHEGLR